MKELPKAYNPAEYEKGIYKLWEASGAFAPYGDGEPFSIVLPPPNVTGSLHVGHAVVVAIEDLMVRYHRMKGDRTLWIPGVDHAAIATQNVVEKKLRKERDVTRHQLGREAFLKEVESFVATTKDRILTQIRSLGASLDWSRLAYTLDPDKSVAVCTIFKQMYDTGILYRGDRIVNWCPRCQSTLSDDEVEYREETTPFYYFRYGPVVIGTARPETKFLDKTIVVHPDDIRYKDLIGSTITVEWIDGSVQATVISDPIVDPKFGTGAMTITPAHSFEDFELAQRHNLPAPLIINEYGKLTEAAGEFVGRRAREVRAAIVEKLRAKGLVKKVDEAYTHNLSVCYRCSTPIEPLPKLQWFINVNKKFREGKSLKDLMRESVKSSKNPRGKIEILPDRYTKVYEHWIDNLRDWCVSRQIWFGHRVPVWYKQEQLTTHNSQLTTDGEEEIYVGVEPPAGEGWQQDPDTLDTWFSSGTWTFSTLGWPASAKATAGKLQKTGDLATFHPTSVLETGYDILFFWVARMILMSQFALGEVPFKTVYLHGLVRDKDRQKMSKSKDNVVDPLGIIEQYGADALRMALIFGTGLGSDIIISEEKVRGMRNFATKLWNIARFVIANVEKDDFRMMNDESVKPSTETDKVILDQLNGTIAVVTMSLERYQFHLAAEQLYDFIWNKFAAVYVEAAKKQLNPYPPQSAEFEGPTTSIRERRKLADNTRGVLLHVLKRSVTLLHPFMPFVTEAIWQELPHATTEPMLMVARWPRAKNVTSQKVE
jgi:valyl-tRNA synthetase